ncbi:MAG: thiamine-phosphate kinase, partial [Candidatus Sumerlaeia bacterium]|nr:thiamine-phosphate kinase [Candidatus Sumerlaeia bacterium]
MPDTRKLADIGEWGLLEKLKRFYPLHNARLIVGFGDDAAVLDFSSESNFYLLATVDTLVEGTHFLSTCYEPILLGKKAVTVNLSDIAAIGGIPEFMLVSLAVPPDFPISTLNTIYQGMLSVAKEHNVILVNGDTVRSPLLTLTICLLGKKPKQEHLPLRSVARPEQYVYVTGTLGESGLGLQLLKTKRKSQLTPPERGFVRRHLDPTARVQEGQWLTLNFSDMALID